MKPIIILLLLVIEVSSAFGTVVRPGEPALLSYFTAGLEEAKAQGKITKLEKWSDIESLPIELQLRMLGTHAQDRPNISDYFVIIPRSEQGKFPKGNLLIISATPFNLTSWYRQWYKENRNYTPEQLSEYDKINPKDDIARWYLAEGKDGKYTRASIAEVELAKIIDQTGLIIPKPVSYRFNMSQVDPATGRPINAPSQNSTPAAASVTKTIPFKLNSPLTTDTTFVESPNFRWWIAGAIAAFVAVVLILRGKKIKK